MGGGNVSLDRGDTAQVLVVCGITSGSLTTLENLVNDASDGAVECMPRRPAEC